MSFTTDNGGNIVLAVEEELGYTLMPCFSHCLNLAVKKSCSISEISKIIACCRRFVEHLNHSSKDTYYLKKKQEDLHYKQQNLIQDCSTR